MVVLDGVPAEVIDGVALPFAKHHSLDKAVYALQVDNVVEVELWAELVSSYLKLFILPFLSRVPAWGVFLLPPNQATATWGEEINDEIAAETNLERLSAVELFAEVWAPIIRVQIVSWTWLVDALVIHGVKSCDFVRKGLVIGDTKLDETDDSNSLASYLR